ncbi:glycoside hydrolase [Bacillus hwajinpoensis]|uniref:beta-fructofuranosidase n=1 Tax=Guptibacillus hwajinpoensis TaxID=208199 RepID=A0A845F4I8_9BACL|nr:GH32 C-terminal domain-containing protein [Pseudalkalibacillus hwajinpoensis]MYL65709.1 glycoside hydrolase [Pseudalkalibacillus hwajinpoensis]
MENSKLKKSLVAHWAFSEGSGSIVHDGPIQDVIHYVFNERRTTLHADEPQWRSGLNEHALVFDGYSTWIERKEGIRSIDQAFTIETWLAPRSFGGIEDERLTGIVNQHNRELNEGFILGIHRHGKWALQIGVAGEWVEVWAENSPIPKLKWSHLAASFNGQDGHITLYLNGEKVAEKTIGQNVSMALSHEALLIGKSNEGLTIENVFSLNMFSGLLDDIKIYNRALSEGEITKSFTDHLLPYKGEIPPLPYQDIAIDRSVYDRDPHRPKFHLTPPGHWMNEPHAPLYFKGKYHLFYQHNPQGPYWGNIQWGHWASDDLVHWCDLPIAIETEADDLAPDGIWSGNAAYDEDGFPVLFFTAGHSSKKPNQMTGLARSTYRENQDIELKKWKKHPVPVTIQPNHMGLHHDGFRDPFVWKEGEIWYQIVGTGIESVSGAAILFTSDNLVDWECKGLLYDDKDQEFPFLGEVWELPILLPIGKGKHLFIISPVGRNADVEVFYWIGTWDKQRYRFIPDQKEPQLIDVGDFHFTGPSAMIDPITGRLLLFTIAQGRRSLKDEYEAGWAHNGGLPVQLWLRDDGRLGVKPIEELIKLRKKKLVSLENLSIEETNDILAHVKGNMLEICVEFQDAVASEYGVKVLKSDCGNVETFLCYNSVEETLNVKKKAGDSNDTHSQGGKISLNGEQLKLHIYVDCSIVECYANELKSITTRVYPEIEALGIEVWANDHLRVKSMEVWEMGPAF